MQQLQKPNTETNNASSTGSNWRRWDLHVHTPGTKLSNNFRGPSDDENWSKFIKILEDSPVRVFGITDYFCCDNYYTLIKKYAVQFPESTKVFFLNIELRLAEAISANETNPHLHIIFDNNEDNCPPEKIKKFLNSLKTQGEDNDGSRISCADLRTAAQFMSASVSFEEVKAALKQTFGDSKPYLLAFPAKNDGVRSTDMKSPRKILITDKIDKGSDIFFGNSDSTEHFLKNDRYENGPSKAKPVVSGSDAHSFEDLERLEGNIVNFEPTWIKADTTFRGLLQICYEPVSRVFIGDEPTIEKRKKLHATKIIKALSIDQVDEYDEGNGEWFKNVKLELNPELTAIIGNKGSGKSALVDILGLLGDSRQENYFSFLTDDAKNKKFRRRGYSENFVAICTWEDSSVRTKALSDHVDKTRPELVRYLPQNYFEQLTNEIEIQQFRKEIEEVVFSHVNRANRMSKVTFQELEEFKTQQSKQVTSLKKTALRELNIEIVSLEEQANPNYRKKLDNELQDKKTELLSIRNRKPEEVLKPAESTEEQKKQAQEIELHSEILEELRQKREELTQKHSDELHLRQRLTLLQEKVKSLDADYKSKINGLIEEFADLNLDINSILGLNTDIAPIKNQIELVENRISLIQADNLSDPTAELDVKSLASLIDINTLSEYHNGQVALKKRLLSGPQRKYQSYLEKLQIWSDERRDILGNELDPAPGTIKFLEKKIAYIATEVAQELSALKASRITILTEIFESKKEILEFYSELKASVDEKLAAVKTMDFEVEIEAAFILDQRFTDNFLGKINKTKKGSFHGANNPSQLITKITNEVDWNDIDQIIEFTDKILGLLNFHNGDPIEVSSQINDVKDFYDFLFSLGFLSTRYELRLGGKNLNELSPGEKGLLLLIFYLQLDKDNIPLIIDQPEDNLDNDSIFAVLAQCIRQAKKYRQVILVTHNPNLAVGADAEQIIYVKLDKFDNYKFSYESGAIENPKINQKIVDILEGSQPAFVKRRLKYQIK